LPVWYFDVEMFVENQVSELVGIQIELACSGNNIVTSYIHVRIKNGDFTGKYKSLGTLTEMSTHVSR